jgi:hypothetical protein
MALIRHGERMDRTPIERRQSYDNINDPPLSFEGIV